jgi:hypothetical protein
MNISVPPSPLSSQHGDEQSKAQTKKPLVGHTKKGKPDMRLKINKDAAKQAAESKAKDAEIKRMKKEMKKSKKSEPKAKGGSAAKTQRDPVASPDRRTLTTTEQMMSSMRRCPTTYQNEACDLYSGDRGNMVMPGGGLLRDMESVRNILRKEAQVTDHRSQVADDVWGQCFT